jgi:ParB-like nuclease domain
MVAIASPPPVTTLHISIEKIVIPEDKALNFDLRDERNVRFIENLDKVGLLEPICVRPLGDEFELVYGRRRLWGAKALKWKFIEAIVAEYSDDEIKFVTIVENVDRTQLTAVQELELLKSLNEVHERLFGPNPGRRTSGRARAAKALRDPVTKQFVVGPKLSPQPTQVIDPDNPHGDFASSPVPVADAVSGPFNVSGAAEVSDGETQSYSRLAAGPLAKSERQTRHDAALAKAFTQSQLRALGKCKQISKRALGKLAKIKNAERRAQAVAFVCSGKAVADAIR